MVLKTSSTLLNALHFMPFTLNLINCTLISVFLCGLCRGEIVCSFSGMANPCHTPQAAHSMKALREKVYIKYRNSTHTLPSWCVYITSDSPSNGNLPSFHLPKGKLRVEHVFTLRNLQYWSFLSSVIPQCIAKPLRTFSLLVVPPFEG